MPLPFTVEQFFAVFRAYNTAVWPAQVLLLALAIVALGLLFVPHRLSSVAISAILAALWAWLGLAYHYAFFAALTPLAYAFAAVSVAGAAAFVWEGVLRRRLEFGWSGTFRSGLGSLLVLFALVAYPAWSVHSGHPYPELPTFGLPCPTTLFTLGLLLFAKAPCPRSPLVVPVVWCFVGAQAAFLLDVPADLGLVVAGIVGLGLLAMPARSARPERGTLAHGQQRRNRP